MLVRPFASLLRETAVHEVSAGSIISDEIPAVAPVPKKKLYAEDLPPEIRAQLQPMFPGSNQARHPITKQFVSLKPKPDSATAQAPEIPPQPASEETRETPQNTPQPTAEPEPTAPAEPTEPPPTEEPPEPGADFSDLPNDDAPPEQPRDPAQEANAHRTIVGIVWDAIISLMATFFGQEWLPNSPQERNSVVEAWVQALLWMGTRILNPLQLAYAATATYCFTRLGTLWRWWQNRRMKRANVEREETVSATDSPAE